MNKIKEFAKKLFTFVLSHKKLALGLVLMTFILIVSVFIYANKKNSTETVPTIHTVYSAQNAPIAQDAVISAAKANGKTISSMDASDIARLANRSASTEKAYAHLITTDEAVADDQAKEIAKDRKADIIIKQTSTDTKASNDKINVSDNNYYIINQERKHSVSVGAADVDSEAYVTVSYHNRKTELTAYYNPQTGKTGAGVSYQIARW